MAVILALSLVLAACGGSAGEATGVEASGTPTPAQAAPDAPQVEPTPDESASGEPAAVDPTDLAEHLREKTMRMWAAYNSYDLDALETFYEENYWKAQEEELRSNMRPFESSGTKITAEETSPPTEIAPGKWETKHVGRFPMGSVNMVFVYEQFGGEWLLTYAEDE